MIPAYLLPIANHLWQSTVFAAAAGLLTLALRRNQARTRYWLWLAASVKFLVPFSVLIGLGSHFEWRTAPAIAQPTVFLAAEQISQPFRAAPVAAATTTAAFPVTDVLFDVWALGFLLVVINWSRKWARMHAAVRAASHLPLPFPVPVKSSSTLIEPGVFGILRSVLVLPEGIADRLTPAQLEAILAHELCHVRHRDNLAAAIHMLVEAIFWFHPLVWWIGARIVEERERACDEEVLRLGSDPAVYAEGILRVCEFYLQSPLTCVAGVTGSDLKKRMERIMRHSAAEALCGWKKIVLTMAGVAAIVAPILVGVLTAPPRLLAQSAKARPAFEVASIKLNHGCEDGRQDETFSPGRVSVTCITPRNLIQAAYGRFANGPNANPTPLRLLGAPEWLGSNRYDVMAKAQGNPPMDQMFGPMLQVLLEDRFRLKVHLETRELPVYTMIVAKGGLKIQASREGSCVPLDLAHAGDPSPNFCGRMTASANGGHVSDSAHGMTMAEIAGRFLSNRLGRPVIDKTGIKGLFDAHLDYALDDAPRGPGNPAAQTDTANPSFFTAVQEQLGLKLESSRGPVEVLVIEHVEKPSEN